MLSATNFFSGLSKPNTILQNNICQILTFVDLHISLFLINLFIFIQLQLSAFSPLPSTPPQPVPPPSPTTTLPLDFVLVSFIVAPIDPSPHYPLPTPLWLLQSTGSNLSAHQQMSGSKNYGTFTQWNSMQQRERRSLYPLQWHGWNWRALC